MEGVRKLLQNLKAHKAAEPDYHPDLHFYSKHQYSNTANESIQYSKKSIQQMKLPEDWKFANVAPILKKGDRSKASNYRPVSLTCICCKVSSSIMQHFEDNNILTDAQHGFRRRRSCETQLLTTVHDLAKGIEDRQQLDVILLDFSKAFDKVPHRRLLHKLHHYGI